MYSSWLYGLLTLQNQTEDKIKNKTAFDSLGGNIIYKGVDLDLQFASLIFMYTKILLTIE